MTAGALLLWLLALPPVLDGNGHPIPRPRAAADVIAVVAIGTDQPLTYAALLDTFAAKESGYRPSAAGDCPGMRAGSLLCTRELGAKSCGAWQTPCGITPKLPMGQAQLALTTLQRSMATCPEHPLSLYGTGRCKAWPGGDARMAIVRAALLIPVPDEDPS